MERTEADWEVGGSYRTTKLLLCWRETLFLSRRGATVAVGRTNDFKTMDESGCGRGNGSEFELGQHVGNGC